MHLCGPSILMNTGGEWTIDCRWVLPTWKIDSCSLEALLLRRAWHGGVVHIANLCETGFVNPEKSFTLSLTDGQKTTKRPPPAVS